MKTDKKIGFSSKLIHAGALEKDPYKSATVPIYQTSTFAFNNADHGAQCFAGESDGYIYTRIGNPTIDALEDVVAQLENGYGAVACSSGMAAVNTIYMALLDKDMHMISTDAVYGPSRVVMEKHFSRFGVQSTYVDTTDVRNIEKEIKENTKLIYIETPSNPTMAIADLKAIAALAKKHGIVTVVDNTFCSPYLQNPLDMGIDVVFHSVTKFINGHADIVGGIIIAKEKAMYEKLNNMMVTLGGNMDPHQAYMVIRGLKTLAIRIEQSQKSAHIVAEFLEKHPKVKWVKYPGLKSHPQYELGKSQMKGNGAMIAFELKGGLEAGKTMMNNVQLAILAVSLGGVETLIQHPASMTHSKMDKESRMASGISDGLVRLSVGIENIEDLLEDIGQALDKV